MAGGVGSERNIDRFSERLDISGIGLQATGEDMVPRPCVFSEVALSCPSFLSICHS